MLFLVTEITEGGPQAGFRFKCQAERTAYRYLAVSGSCRQRGGFGPAASRLGGCGAGGTSGEARRLSKRLAAQALKGRNQEFASAGGCE